jgi:hypothetical protein
VHFWQKAALFANHEKTLGYELAEQLDREHPDVILYQTDRLPNRGRRWTKWGSFRLAVDVSHFSAFRLPTNAELTTEFGILKRFSEDESTTNLYRSRHRQYETILNWWVLARVRVPLLFAVRKHPGSARRPPRPRP